MLKMIAFILAQVVLISTFTLPIPVFAENEQNGGTIISFFPLEDDAAIRSVSVGTDITDLGLPEKLIATVRVTSLSEFNLTSPSALSIDSPIRPEERALIAPASEHYFIPGTNVYDFGFTNNIQWINLPAGEYLLEVWGASGGTENHSFEATTISYGGLGGYFNLL